MFIRCEPPRGPAIDFGWLHSLTGEALRSPEDGFEIGEDGGTNVYPTFFTLGDRNGARAGALPMAAGVRRSQVMQR